MKRSLRILAAVSSIFAGALHAQETIEVPWNDAIPPGTEPHIERALQDSTRHG